MRGGLGDGEASLTIESEITSMGKAGYEEIITLFSNLQSTRKL